MGYSQGKMMKPDEINNQSLISKDFTNEKISYSINENYKTISKTTKKDVECIVIEFINNENKQVDCEISLNRINFEEVYEMDFIFDSVLKVFENMGINLPLVIFLNIENARINIFLKLQSVDEIIVITNKFISVIKNFSKLMKFTNDIDFKVHKKPEIQSNYSPLNSNNSYINCFSTNPSKGAKAANSCLIMNNDADNMTANKSKILVRDLNVATAVKKDVSSKKESNEFMSSMYTNTNINTINNNNSNLTNKKRMLTFDNNNTDDLEKNALNPPTTNISNETLLNNNLKENSEDNCFHKHKEGGANAAQLQILDESINRNLRIDKTESIEKKIIENSTTKNEEKVFPKKANKNEDLEAANKVKTLEFSHEELERMYFMKQNEEIFENRDLIMEQPKEEIEKLFKELLVNKQSAASTGNLLLNENFLNSEHSMNRICFDEAEENFQENISVDSTLNNIIENSLKNKCSKNINNNLTCINIEDRNNLNPTLGKFEKNMKFTFDEIGFDIANNNKTNNNNNVEINKDYNYDLKQKEKRLNDMLRKQRLLNNKEITCVNEKYLKKSPIIINNTNTFQVYKRNPNPLNHDSINKVNSNNINNNFPNFSKNAKKFHFPMQQEHLSNYQNTMNFNSNSNSNLETNHTSNEKSSNHFGSSGGDNLNGIIKNQNTRNYYINNILNFNPGNSFIENPKMQNISNLNTIINPSLINHNMLMMMKKFNQNSNNSILNNSNNILLNPPAQNFTNQSHLNHIMNSTTCMASFNNNQPNIQQINLNNGSLTGNFNHHFNDLNSKNYFINNNLNAFENPNPLKSNKMIEIENKILIHNNLKVSNKEIEEKLEYLEDKVKLISLEEDYLEGFYFKKSDYISDEDFISFFFIGNLNHIKNNSAAQAQLESAAEAEIQQIQASILSKYFKETFNLKLKQIIHNPSESESISRLVFYKHNQANKINYCNNNSSNQNQILKETDGLEHKKIKILNDLFILIRIKSLVLKLHPEELYVDLQLKVNFEINNYDERDFVNFLANNLQIDFFEISFISEGECILTFYEREALKDFVSLLQKKPYQQIKGALKKVKIETSILSEPFPIKGKKINILYYADEEDKEYEDVEESDKEVKEKMRLPLRPPACIKLLSGYYTPSLRRLLSDKDLWNQFKIEKNNFEIITIEQFNCEIHKTEFEQLKAEYSYNAYGNEIALTNRNLIFTIIDYASKPKKAKLPQLQKFMLLGDEKEESAAEKKSIELTRGKNKMNSNINNKNNNHETNKALYLKNKVVQDEIDSSSEVKFSSSKDKSESSFSLSNLSDNNLEVEDSQLDLVEDSNKPFSKLISHKESEVKIYKKRGRKRKRNITITEEIVKNTNSSSNRHLLHRNDYGKKFINDNNNFRRSYNHSRYSANNLQLESCIDPSKPNILDELIENNLDSKEKIILEKIEKEVQERIFKKNASTNEFLPKKRGRRPKNDYYCIKDLSENRDFFSRENIDKVPFRDIKHINDICKDYNNENSENKILDNNNEREYDYKYGFGKGEIKSSFDNNNKKGNELYAQISAADDDDFKKLERKKEANLVDTTIENLKKNCLNEDIICKILNRKGDSKFEQQDI